MDRPAGYSDLLAHGLLDVWVREGQRIGAPRIAAAARAPRVARARKPRNGSWIPRGVPAFDFTRYDDAGGAVANGNSGYAAREPRDWDGRIGIERLECVAPTLDLASDGERARAGGSPSHGDRRDAARQARD